MDTNSEINKHLNCSFVSMRLHCVQCNAISRSISVVTTAYVLLLKWLIMIPKFRLTISNVKAFDVCSSVASTMEFDCVFVFVAFFSRILLHSIVLVEHLQTKIAQCFTFCYIVWHVL